MRHRRGSGSDLTGCVRILTAGGALIDVCEELHQVLIGSCFEGSTRAGKERVLPSNGSRVSKVGSSRWYKGSVGVDLPPPRIPLCPPTSGDTAILGQGWRIGVDRATRRVTLARSLGGGLDLDWNYKSLLDGYRCFTWWRSLDPLDTQACAERAFSSSASDRADTEKRPRTASTLHFRSHPKGRTPEWR